MLIVGAKGFAKEILQIFHHLNKLENIAFYDDFSKNVGEFVFDKFVILKNKEQVKTFFLNNTCQFTIGIGNPLLRYKLYQKFSSINGIFVSTISPRAIIGSYEVTIGDGSNILDNVIISNSTVIGKGCILYYTVTVTHDCIVGDFVELSPGVTLLGRSKVGDFCQIGANSTILPDVEIGKNVIIGAGSVVTKDIPDNCKVVGVPARIIKENLPFHFE